VTTDGPANKAFSLPFARIALVLAALIALGAIVIAVLRSRDGGESPAAAAQSAPAGNEQGQVADVGAMIGGLEKKMADNPRDPRGWFLLGQAYYHVGRYADSAKAYAKSAELAPNDAMTWSALGEAQLLSGPGGVTPEAEASFRKALAIDPKDHRARYFMAVGKEREGKHTAAVDDLIEILRDSPAGAPWIDPVRQLAVKIASDNKIDITGRIPDVVSAPQEASGPPTGDSVATAGIPGPTAADLQAATSMTPSQQDEMARGMVDRLAAKLRSNPKNADGWIMLIRSRLMLGDMPGAKTALSQAKAAFQGDAAQQGRFDDAARALGVAH
jgi:cytochrome c-type biogenesis protein CcmH